MVLSGTLREYILADVFQLLTQQKITGKLILNSGNYEGFVVFKNGLVIYAEKNNEKLSEKILNYLNSFSRKPITSIIDTISTLDNDINNFTLELIKRGFLTREEMSSLAEATIEDICCSLFLWKTGTYRFTSLNAIDEFTLLNLTFPVENIVMEAMRRTDEWYRMQEFIKIDTIFVRGSKDAVCDTHSLDPLKNSEQYIFSRIDGTSPVSELVKDSCLSEYKVYETLYNLCLNKTIIPLSDKYTRSVKAALEQKKHNHSVSPFSSIISIAAVFFTIAVLIFSASLLINNLFLSKPFNELKTFKTELNNIKSEQNLSMANIYYRTYFGIKPVKIEQLATFKLIAKQDIINLRSKESLINRKKNKK